MRDLFAPANFSPCRRWRYTLFRRFDSGSGFAMFIGLNPSTADETTDDPTVRRCIRFARDWGYGGLLMTNLFGYRATNPRDMVREPYPIGDDNDDWLRLGASQAGVVVAAWGVWGEHVGRAKQVMAMLPNLHCLAVTKAGHPGHPLYLRADLRPAPFPRDV